MMEGPENKECAPSAVLARDKSEEIRRAITEENENETPRVDTTTPVVVVLPVGTRGRQTTRIPTPVRRSVDNYVTPSVRSLALCSSVWLPNSQPAKVKVFPNHKLNDVVEMSNPRTNAPSTSSDPEVEATLQSLERFEKNVTEETGMWIFGYGSLCWNQGFAFEKSMTGFIRGFSRKFWQGNTTHRGTQKKPGRVATLVEEQNGIVWGQAFQVMEKKAFSYLNNRECELGGYLTTIATFYPRQEATEDKCAKPFPVILYLATPSNRLWLGDSPLADIATQIVECTGNSGHNVEYLLRLANFVRENIPEAVDDHLFSLECLVRSQIKKRNLCLKTLMGESILGKTGADDAGQQDGREVDDGTSARTDSLQFTSTVQSKKLRCVNI